MSLLSPIFEQSLKSSPQLRFIPLQAGQPIYSVIITTYKNSFEDLSRCIDSVLSQKAKDGTQNLPPLSFEVIVVDDGSPDPLPFYDYAKQFKTNHKPQVSHVYLPDDIILNRTINCVVFTRKKNGGLGSARNFGISLASGLWVLPLDADDFLNAFLFHEITDAFRVEGPGINLYNPGTINVIMPGMADKYGIPYSWQPSADLTNLLEKNPFHCCGLFLRAIWTEGFHYDETLVFGWEDWAFWIKLHTSITIQPLIIEKPLYHYTISENKPHMSHFCSSHQPVCMALLRFANPSVYKVATLESDLLLLCREVELLTLHPAWRLVLARADTNPDPLANLLVRIAQSGGVLPHTFDSLLEKIKPLKADGICIHWSNFILNKTGHSSFHLILTRQPSTLYHQQLLNHVILGIFLTNTNAIVYIHSYFPEFFQSVLLSFCDLYRKRIFFMPMCDEFLCSQNNATVALCNFFEKNAGGRPYFYSHFTDMYRLLLLLNYGGVYMDTDILLQRDVSNLRNSLAIESDDPFFLNGAFLAFEKGHPFILACLAAIPLSYNASVWNTIGPALLTKIFMDKKAQIGDISLLPSSSFYSYHFREVCDLRQRPISLEDYETHPGYGSHLWNKLPENNSFEIHPLSRVGRLLNATCMKTCMKCIDTTYLNRSCA